MPVVCRWVQCLEEVEDDVGPEWDMDYTGPGLGYIFDSGLGYWIGLVI